MKSDKLMPHDALSLQIKTCTNIVHLC